MIPLSLELEAFLPFKERMKIDFTLAEEDRMFLITGKTGSGKTAVFDAICFALYGEASGSQRSGDSLKCQFAGDDVLSFVEFRFASQGEIYTLRRTPPQNRKRRNGNVSPEPATAVLTLNDGTTLSRISEVNRKIEEILGLSCEQFKKIVMLPQGEFRKFLSDSSAGRQEILRKIFSTRIFDDFTEALRQETRETEEKLSALSARRQALLGQISPLSDEELEIAIREEYPDYGKIMSLLPFWIAKFEQESEQKKEKNENLRKVLHNLNPEEAADQNRRLAELQKAKERQKILLSEEASIHKTRQLLDQLSHCGELCLLYDSLTLSAHREEESAALAEDASEKLALLLPRLEKAQKKFEVQEEMGLEIPKKSELLSVSRSRFTVFEALETLTREETDTQKKLTDLKVLQEEQKLRQEHEACLREQKALHSLAQITAQSELFWKEAEEAFLIWQENYSRFLAGQAALLSRELKDGIPCPVCGSLSHPAPAVWEGIPISREELDRSSAAYDTARQKAEEQKRKLSAALAENRLLLASEEEEPDPSQISPALSRLRMKEKTLAEQLSNLPDSSLSLSPEETVEALAKTSALAENQAIRVGELRVECESFGLSREELAAEIDALQEFLDTHSQLLKEASGQLEKLRKEEQSITLTERENRRLSKEYREEKNTLSEKFAALLKAQSLSKEEFFSLREQMAEIPALKDRISRHEREQIETEKLIETEEKLLAGKEPVDLPALLAEQKELKSRLEKGEQEYESFISALSGNRRVLSQLADSETEYEALSRQYGSTAQLYQAASGRNQSRVSFERYVLAFYFDQVVESANLRFHSMSGGRYFLRRKESRERGNAPSGLDLEIFDSYSGKFRHVNTLSGGESFKTALCLALGLADVITRSSGGVEIDTIFIDEGFGTLDGEALETAVDCLRELKESGRYIGVISHVAELSEKIPLKLRITAGTDGSKVQFLSC